MSKWVWDGSGGRATYDFDTDTYINMPYWFRDPWMQRQYERAVEEAIRE